MAKNGDAIESKTSRWTFGGNVSKSFDALIVSDMCLSKQAGIRVYPKIWDICSKNKLTNLKKDLDGIFPKKFFPFFSKGHFNSLLIICEKNTKLNKNCLPDSCIYSNIFNKLIRNNYVIIKNLNKTTKIFKEHGYRNCNQIIIKKLRKKLKN